MNGIFTIAGTCVNHDRVFRATIHIDLSTGLIVAIREFSLVAALVLPDHCLIFPGFLDMHMHFREDATGKECHKETFETGGEACVNGGIVHAGGMGNTPEPPIDDESYEELEKLSKKSRVPILLYAMMGPDTHPLRRHVPYKMCLARTTGANDIIFFPTYESMEATASRYRGQHVSMHCEDHILINKCKGELLHENKRPPVAETVAIDHAIDFITRYFGQGKLCHCSVCKGIRKKIEAKSRGINVTCEVTPHHLYFDLSMVDEKNRPWMQMNPPLRSPEDRLYCIEALRSGGIEMLASDHAPHTEEDKLSGASGQPHADTYGPFATWLMIEHQFRPEDLARVCSYAPAQFLNQFLSREQYGRGYGMIDDGYVGSLTVIDMQKPITIEKSMLKTKCNWSPFEGITFPGSVRHTIIKGQVLK
jgi:dihydroorotase